MDSLNNPFADYVMDERELDECVSTLIRLHGGHAASYLIDHLNRAESETAARNWGEIAERYAKIFEGVLRARDASSAEVVAQHKALGGYVH